MHERETARVGRRKCDARAIDRAHVRGPSKIDISFDVALAETGQREPQAADPRVLCKFPPLSAARLRARRKNADLDSTYSI